MANIIQINGKKVKDINAVRMSSLAPVESSTTASMAHAVGDYFWLNGTLYEATAAITIGNAISVGTNCKITNLGEGFDDLKSQIDASPVESGSAAGSVQTKPFTYSDATITQIASGVGSFAEGYDTVANGMGAHVEGVNSKSLNGGSHAEGLSTRATNVGAHAEGSGVIATGQAAHIEGGSSNINCTITGEANATTYTVANATMASILLNSPIFVYSLNKMATVTAIDIVNKTITVSATFGEELSGVSATIYRAYASGNASHVEGIRCLATYQNAHAEGNITQAHNSGSHAEGSCTIASGSATHAEGLYTIAIGEHSHTENYNTLAYGENTHAENLGEKYTLQITGDAEATTYTYSGTGDPSVGDVVKRQQYCSRITAVDSVNKTFTVDTTLHYQLAAQSLDFYCSGAFGANSHVEGKGTTAIGNEQHVQGRYNTVDNNNTYAEIVGNGTAHGDRSNARTLDWNGNEEVAGDVIAYGCGGENPISLTNLKNQTNALGLSVVNGMMSVTFDE